ncbi:ATP-dependent DNA helicase RecG [Striga asiatica]|uniref:ATP-dependent DNA helicase RecG n=1 Tax=Striga asiatica TaxID=4170 RepID=A0A5A7RIQ2_STRAF|nr:ATP-dependent DNA helicase RecG [Striga asiatica]
MSRFTQYFYKPSSSLLLSSFPKFIYSRLEQREQAAAAEQVFEHVGLWSRLLPATGAALFHGRVEDSPAAETRQVSTTKIKVFLSDSSPSTGECDVAIAAYLDVRGASLKDLSPNNITQVTFEL